MNYNERVKERFFITYNPFIVDYLKKNGFSYILQARHSKTNNLFFMYDRSSKLDQVMDRYHEYKKKLLG